MEQHYKFNPSNFNAEGINTKDGTLFLDLVREWEQDFHDRFYPLYANSVCVNYFTMQLIQNSIPIGNQENRGIEGFQGAFYLGRSLKIDNYIISPMIVYAIGSKFDVNKPIWFVKYHTIVNGMAILKHDSDSDNDTDGGDDYLYDKNPIIHADAKRIKAR